MVRRRTPEPIPEIAVKTPAELARFVELLHDEPLIGLDTEFVGEESYRPELCLVQVATSQTLAVIDPYRVGDLRPFWELLATPGFTTIAHAGREEIRMCHHGIGGAPARVFDVQIAAAFVGYPYPIGYSGLVQEALGARTSKAETLTDWRRRPLTASQIRYAFDDVRYLLELHDVLVERLTRLKRLGWADEEFGAAVARATADDFTSEKWRKLKGLGGLGRRELAIARELFRWRDDYASRVNRPARVLMRDDILVEIARRGSSRVEDFTTLRGIPRQELPSILDAIERTSRMTTKDYPSAAERDHDPAHVATLASLLGVVLAEFAARAKIAPNLVATNHDLKVLVRKRQPGAKSGEESTLEHGWRAQHVKPYLDAVLDGHQAIRVSDPASQTPISVHPIAGAPKTF